MASLYDDFSGGSISGTKWLTTTTNGSVTVVSQQMVASTTSTTSADEAWLRSANSGDVTGDWVATKVISGPTDFTSYGGLRIVDAASPLRAVQALITGSSGNTVYLQTFDASGASLGSTNGGFDFSSTPFLRIRESSGTFYVESATTVGGSWSTITSLSVPSGFVKTAAKFDVGCLPTEFKTRTWTFDDIYAPAGFLPAASVAFRPGINAGMIR